MSDCNQLDRSAGKLNRFLLCAFALLSVLMASWIQWAPDQSPSGHSWQSVLGFFTPATLSAFAPRAPFLA